MVIDDKAALLADLRTRMQSVIDRDRERTASDDPAVEDTGPESVLPGKEVETLYGPVFVVTTRYGAGELFGHMRLTEFLDLQAAPLAAWTGHPWLAELPLDRALFFDIETAGAAGAPGTFPFLTGLGVFEGREFVVRQVFSRDHGDEAAGLQLVYEAARDASFLVSFNGIGFDTPMLAQRMRLHGLDASVLFKPQLDLLPFSRRLWRGAFENCRLLTLEERVVGHARSEDIPGQLIPLRYAEYLVRRDIRYIRVVFDHNRWDVAAMPPLAARIGACAAASDPVADGLSHAEAAAVGRDRKAAGDADGAVAFLRHGALAPGRIGRQAATHLSRVYKSMRRTDDAVSLWRSMIERQEVERRFDPFPYEEWSKHLEHWVRDFTAAAEVAEQGLARCPDTERAARDQLARRATRARWRALPKDASGR